MNDFLTIEYLENVIKDMLPKGITGKIIVSFPNEESYNKYMKEVKEQMRKEINKPLDKTRRSKIKSIWNMGNVLYIIDYYKIPNKYLKSIVGNEPRIDDIIKTKRKEYKIINYKYCSGGRYKVWVLETNSKNNEVEYGDFVY